MVLGSFSVICGQNLTLPLAGIEQTAHGVGFILYLLALNPPAQEKLRQALLEVKVGYMFAFKESSI